ncbi:IclR family transcriptional regulator [Rhodococcus sp. NPDC127530]|uniref:IclR family transcriptional regulator n=1 Tax=unclassified Rhodococcus (in: high G+C Gram-positive bacteria) TaxID=192944 RepID=UPI00363875EA
MLGTINKAGRVLDLFTFTTPEWGVSEVAAEIRVPKSSAHALLATLTDIGLLRRVPDGRYRLGWRIPDLNRTLVGSTDFLVTARARTQQLADQLHATIHVAALREHDIIYLDKVIGGGTTDFASSGVGLAAPVHCTALGKVLLAALDTKTADALIDRHGLSGHTPRTITSSTRLREELVATRRRGWGYDLEEAANRVCCVAAPIRDHTGTVQAAISASIPRQLFGTRRDLLLRNIQAAAASISRQASSTGSVRHIGVGVAG